MKETSFSLPVTIMREGEDFVAYSPALDISTVGSTFEEVKKRFEESVSIFFVELEKMGTLEETLHDLGWKKVGNKIKPPTVVSQETERFTINTPFAHA